MFPIKQFFSNVKISRFIKNLFSKKVNIDDLYYFLQNNEKCNLLKGVQKELNWNENNFWVNTGTIFPVLSKLFQVLLSLPVS